MSYRSLLLFLPLLLISCTSAPDGSVRRERKAILAGNEKYAQGDYLGAMDCYSKALDANGSSAEGAFNLGVAQLAYSAALEASGDTLASKYAEAGESTLSLVAGMRGRAVPVAAMACYNLANRNFRADKLEEAIGLYMQSLRLVPGFPDAVRNLRIAQLKQQENEDQNKDKDQNQNQDQNQDQNQNKDKDQDQNQNEDKNQNKDQDQKQEQQNPQQPDGINSQAAAGILQSVENKENSLRARLGGSQGKNDNRQSPNRKPW